MHLMLFCCIKLLPAIH